MLEYVGDVSANLIATLIGAGFAFYISLKVTEIQKEKKKFSRKSRLVKEIKKELLEIKGNFTEPLKYYSNFRDFIFEDQMINGTQFSMDFIGYKQLMKSDTSELFSYETVQKIALVELDFQGYAQLEGIRLKFNVEFQHNENQRENLAKSIIETFHKKQKQIIEAIDDALKELEKET